MANYDESLDGLEEKDGWEADGVDESVLADAPPFVDRELFPMSAEQAATLGLELVIQRPDLHEHELTLYSRRYANSYTCDLCMSDHFSAAYSCDACGYDTDPACVANSAAALEQKDAAFDAMREKFRTSSGRIHHWLKEMNAGGQLPTLTAPFLFYLNRLTLGYAARILHDVRFDALTGRIRCPHFLLSALAERKALNEPVRQRRNAHQQLALAYSDSRVGQMPTIGASHWVAEFAQSVPSCAAAVRALSPAQQADLVALIDSFLQTLGHVRGVHSDSFQFPRVFSILDLASAFGAEPLWSAVVDWMMSPLFGQVHVRPGTDFARFESLCPRSCAKWSDFLALEFEGGAGAMQRWDERSWYHDEALVQRYANDYAAGRLLQGDSYFFRRFKIRPVQFYATRNLTFENGAFSLVDAPTQQLPDHVVRESTNYLSFDLIDADGRELPCFVGWTPAQAWPIHNLTAFDVLSRTTGRAVGEMCRALGATQKDGWVSFRQAFRDAKFEWRASGLIEQARVMEGEHQQPSAAAAAMEVDSGAPHVASKRLLFQPPDDIVGLQPSDAGVAAAAPAVQLASADQTMEAASAATAATVAAAVEDGSTAGSAEDATTAAGVDAATAAATPEESKSSEGPHSFAARAAEDVLAAVADDTSAAALGIHRQGLQQALGRFGALSPRVDLAYNLPGHEEDLAYASGQLRTLQGAGALFDHNNEPDHDADQAKARMVELHARRVQERAEYIADTRACIAKGRAEMHATDPRRRGAQLEVELQALLALDLRRLDLFGPSLYTANHPPRVRVIFAERMIQRVLDDGVLVHRADGSDSATPAAQQLFLPTVLVHIIAEYAPADLPYIANFTTADEQMSRAQSAELPSAPPSRVHVDGSGYDPAAALETVFPLDNTDSPLDQSSLLRAAGPQPPPPFPRMHVSRVPFFHASDASLQQCRWARAINMQHQHPICFDEESQNLHALLRRVEPPPPPAQLPGQVQQEPADDMLPAEVAQDLDEDEDSEPEDAGEAADSEADDNEATDSEAEEEEA